MGKHEQQREELRQCQGAVCDRHAGFKPMQQPGEPHHPGHLQHAEQPDDLHHSELGLEEARGGLKTCQPIKRNNRHQINRKPSAQVPQRNATTCSLERITEARPFVLHYEELQNQVYEEDEVDTRVGVE